MENYIKKKKKNMGPNQTHAKKHTTKLPQMKINELDIYYKRNAN